MGNMERYKGAINTAIVKVFDMTVGITGMASKHLTASGMAHTVSTTHNGSHAGYYPGSQQMTMQIAFSPVNGRLLGAQVAGYEGADKRLDIMASVIKLGGTIYDLAEFEHAYAPPYSSAKDPVNMAGFVAENIIHDKLNVFYWSELEKINETDLLVDVRTKQEFANGKIEGAINIPVDEIRDRLHELPKDRNIFIYCEAGLRGYLAQRVLKQNGYNQVQNLSGGYKLWKSCISESAEKAVPA
jgi:rhodanese-related sulfurtransferase